MPQTTKKPARSASTKTKPKKKAVPEFAKPFYKKRWFAVLILILLFSSIGGGYMIRRGDAATYVFIRRAPQMSAVLTAETPARNLDMKSDGVAYKLISAYPEGDIGWYAIVHTFLTKQEATESNKICAHFKVFASGSHSYNIKIQQMLPTTPPEAIRERYMTLAPTTKSGNICLDNPSHIDSTIRVSGAPLSATVGIDTIYGLH